MWRFGFVRRKHGILTKLTYVYIINFDNYERLFFLGICVALKRAVYSVRWELK